MRGGTSSSIRPIELMDRHAASLLDESVEADKSLAMQHQEATAPMPSGMSGVSIRVFGVDAEYPDGNAQGKSPASTNGKFTTLVDSRSLAFASPASGKSRLAGGSTPVLGGGGGGVKAAPPPSPSFPFTFSDDLPGLEDEPLPVRLGLAPPSSPFTGPPPTYYLCNPPPQHRPTTPPSPTTRRRREAAGLTGPDLSLYMSASDQASTSAYTLDTPGSPFAPKRNGTPTTKHGSSRASEDWSDPNRKWDPEEYFRHEHVYLRGRTRISKWHGYSATKAPWYYSYDAEVMQADQLLHGVTTCALQRPSLSPFPPGQQPARVLDVGCGVGHWTIDTALEWKDTEFIGMDLVPIQTPVAVMGNEDLSKRVSWVVANFLEEWPFPDGSFDFVNMRYIEAGVPETMWDHVLSEAVRVAAPGACIEVIVAAVPFLGNPYLLSQADMDIMSAGKPDRFTAPGDEGGGQALPRNQSYEAIKIVYAKMDNRRFINPKPLTVVPGAMLPLDVTDRKQTLIRRFPMRADPFSQMPNDPVDGTDRRYTSGAQNAMAQSIVNTSLNLDNRDVMRGLVIWTSATMRSASRELVWEEAERERKAEVRRRGQDPLNARPALERYSSEDLEANKPFLHPWASRTQFEIAMDKWRDELFQRAGMDVLCQKMLGWKAGSVELNKETRKHVERQRKMSVSTARSVPLSSPIINMQLDPLKPFQARGRAASEGFSSPIPGLASPAAGDGKVAVLGYREVGIFVARKKF